MSFSTWTIVHGVSIILAAPLSCGTLIGSACGCIAGLRSLKRKKRKQFVGGLSTDQETEEAPLLLPTLLTTNGEEVSTSYPSALSGRSLPRRPTLDSRASSSDEEETLVEAAPFSEESFIVLLRRLVAQSRYLQNDARHGLLPKEYCAVAVVLDEIACFSRKIGGPLDIQELVAKPEEQASRVNLRVAYDSREAVENSGGALPEAECMKPITFVTHLDVLPVRYMTSTVEPRAKVQNGLSWFLAAKAQDPFCLVREADRLHGCGTSTCLGHVALLTQLLCALGQYTPKLGCKVIVIFLAALEGGESGLSADWLLEEQRWEESREGPIFWLGVPGSRLCCGSMGSLGWTIRAVAPDRGGGCASGLNSIELVSKVVSQVQDGFKVRFPRHQLDDDFHFTSCSSMRPLRTRCRQTRHTEAIVEGEIRLTPAYRVADVMATVQSLVDAAAKEILSPHSNEQDHTNMDEHPSDKNLSKIELIWADRPSRRPRSRNARGRTDWRGAKGRTAGGPQKASFLELAEDLEGVVVDRSTEGHRALAQTLADVCGVDRARQFSVSGSIPYVRRLCDAGFDIQLFGFGIPEWHRQEVEYCSLCDMRKGNNVLQRLVEYFGHPHDDLADSLASEEQDSTPKAPSADVTKPHHVDAAEKPLVLEEDVGNLLLASLSLDSLPFLRQPTFSEPASPQPRSPWSMQPARKRANSGPITARKARVKKNEEGSPWPTPKTSSPGRRSTSGSPDEPRRTFGKMAESMRSKFGTSTPSADAASSKSTPELSKIPSVPAEWTTADVQLDQSEVLWQRQVAGSPRSRFPLWCDLVPSPPRDASTGLISSPPQSPRASVSVELLHSPQVEEESPAAFGAEPEEPSAQQQEQPPPDQEGEGEEDGWFPYITGFAPF